MPIRARAFSYHHWCLQVRFYQMLLLPLFASHLRLKDRLIHQSHVDLFIHAHCQMLHLFYLIKYYGSIFKVWCFLMQIFLLFSQLATYLQLLFFSFLCFFFILHQNSLFAGCAPCPLRFALVYRYAPSSFQAPLNSRLTQSLSLLFTRSFYHHLVII